MRPPYAWIHDFQLTADGKVAEALCYGLLSISLYLTDRFITDVWANEKTWGLNIRCSQESAAHGFLFFWSLY